MPRGGYRKNAGSKPKWIHGKTKVIRVPVALAEQILEIARILDEGRSLDSVTSSKTINLGGVPIIELKKGPVVYLQDLLKAGYKIRPLALANRLQEGIDRGIWSQ